MDCETVVRTGCEIVFTLYTAPRRDAQAAPDIMISCASAAVSMTWTDSVTHISFPLYRYLKIRTAMTCRQDDRGRPPNAMRRDRVCNANIENKRMS